VARVDLVLVDRVVLAAVGRGPVWRELARAVLAAIVANRRRREMISRLWSLAGTRDSGS
jgi:hypothetical protein